MNKVRVLSQKRIFQGRLLEVFETELQLSNGKHKVHHIAKRPPVVCVLPITDSYEVYLVSQYRYMLDKVTLEVMAGFVEKGEMPLLAAKRELKEETGIQAENWKNVSTIEMAGSVFRAKAHIFIAKNLKKGKSYQEDYEDISLVKITLDDAVSKVLSGKINHSASMIAILLAQALRKEKKK